MAFLCINSGSSSLKWKLFRVDQKELLAEGKFTGIGSEHPESQHRVRGIASGFAEGSLGGKDEEPHELLNNLEAAVSHLINLLTGHYKEELPHIEIVAHRVVHGAHHKQPIRITDQVERELMNLARFAPLHNSASMRAYEVAKKALSDQVKHYAVFDTSFFHALPSKAFLYGLPYQAYTEHGIRRYGFHGLSHSFLLRSAASCLGQTGDSLSVITVHLGSGSSLAAIRNGKPLDCSMGLTPVAGVLMATRTGDIDPTAIFHCRELLGSDQSDAAIENFLNTQCGFKGLCGSSDIREVEKMSSTGDDKAQAAYDVFVYGIQKYIGAYFVALGHVDAIVFSGGIGEHSSSVRASICAGLVLPLGVHLNAALNQNPGAERIISTADSKLRVLVIPTDEELQMVHEVSALL